ncbi:uncharacterized protein LOC114671009 [Macaca mulatta]
MSAGAGIPTPAVSFRSTLGTVLLGTAEEPGTAKEPATLMGSHFPPWLAAGSEPLKKKLGSHNFHELAKCVKQKILRKEIDLRTDCGSGCRSISPHDQNVSPGQQAPFLSRWQLYTKNPGCARHTAGQEASGPHAPVLKNSQAARTRDLWQSVSGTHSLPQDIDDLLWMDLSGHSLYKQAACVEQASLQAHGRRFEGWTQRPPGRWPCWGACEVPRSDEGDRTFQMHPLLSAQQEHGEAEPGWPKQKEGWWLIRRKSPGSGPPLAGGRDSDEHPGVSENKT